jgi:serine/threonine protein kinase
MLLSGEGGFGFVVHCRKKSTGKHYAMKLQTKKGNSRSSVSFFLLCIRQWTTCVA